MVAQLVARMDDHLDATMVAQTDAQKVDEWVVRWVG
jgi:hypothetical protein